MPNSKTLHLIFTSLHKVKIEFFKLTHIQNQSSNFNLSAKTIQILSWYNLLYHGFCRCWRHGTTTPNNGLQVVWKTVYEQIHDLYLSRWEKVTKIDIDQKNFYHISGAVGDSSKSIILPKYCPDKLCETTFSQYSRSCVKVKRDNKIEK